MIEINNNDNRTTAQNLFDSPFSLMLTLYYMQSVNSNYTRTIEHTLDLGTAEAISCIIYLYTLILSYHTRSCYPGFDDIHIIMFQAITARGHAGSFVFD